MCRSDNVVAVRFCVTLFQIAYGRVLKDMKIQYEKIKNTAILIAVTSSIVYYVNLLSSECEVTGIFI